MATVKVFTPNFKHITVKITPNMTLLQVIKCIVIDGTAASEADFSKLDCPVLYRSWRKPAVAPS